MRTGGVMKVGHPDSTIRKIVEIVMKTETECSRDATFVVQK
jgi:hypothetical protein